MEKSLTQRLKDIAGAALFVGGLTLCYTSVYKIGFETKADRVKAASCVVAGELATGAGGLYLAKRRLENLLAYHNKKEQ